MRKVIAGVMLAVFAATSINVLADVQIKSGASSDVLTIDSVSKAARVSRYDARGNSVEQKRTCSAGLTNVTATTAGTGPFFTICGSATAGRTLRVQRIYISGRVATAAIVGTVVLTKTTTATSAGTPVALTQVLRDSSMSATPCSANLCNYYSALATTGTSAGVVGARTGVFPITATVAATDQVPQFLFDFRDNDEAEAVVLRGVAECLQASFGATTTNAPTLMVYVVWTEEP